MSRELVNHAMVRKPHELNLFTKKVHDRCLKYGKATVTLRSETTVEVYLTKFKEGTHVFHSEGYVKTWFADGSSTTNEMFDILSIRTL